jgi:hypothetical protein
MEATTQYFGKRFFINMSFMALFMPDIWASKSLVPNEHVRVCLQELLYSSWTCLQLHVYKSLCYSILVQECRAATTPATSQISTSQTFSPPF